MKDKIKQLIKQGYDIKCDDFNSLYFTSRSGGIHSTVIGNLEEKKISMIKNRGIPVDDMALICYIVSGLTDKNEFLALSNEIRCETTDAIPVTWIEAWVEDSHDGGEVLTGVRLLKDWDAYKARGKLSK